MTFDQLSIARLKESAAIHQRRFFLLSALSASLTACQAKTNDAGTLLPLDLKGNPMPPETPYEQWLTDKPSYFNLSPQLQLAIPAKYQQLWHQKNVVARRIEDMKKESIGGPIEFNFFMPDFSGYTPENYDKEFHADHVYVLVEAQGMGAEKPGASGKFPENMYQREIIQNGGERVATREMLHGLECYKEHLNPLPGVGDRRSCTV